jgi:hypothetical protein
MIKELNLDCPYKVFYDSDDSIYFFDTNSGVRYIAYFTDADEYFEEFHLRNNIFTFGFEPKKTTGLSNKILGDNDIKLTLITIIKTFFLNKNNVLTFVADISGFKQKARNRLFELWKYEYDINVEFEIYDVEIKTDDETYYSSMLIHKDNVHKSEYKKAFLLTTDGLNK